jgi:hypothetical protein
MTDYDKLSDRQIDSLVADRLFEKVPCDSWKPANFGSAGGPAFMLESGSCSHDGKCYPRQEGKSMMGPYGGAPHYTTDAKARDKVVEKMRELGWTVATIQGEHDNNSACAFLDVGACPYGVGELLLKHLGNWFYEHGLKESVIFTDQSLGRAVCIAALKALEAQ